MIEGSHQSFMLTLVELLFAAVIFVPLAHKLRLGPVLGYLLAGLAIGPWGLRFITETENINQVSELGVVFFLFIIGLELDLQRLWSLRLQLFGMGSAQIFLVTSITTAIGVALGFTWNLSMLAGLGFSLSSTAIAAQVLDEQNLLKTPGGSSAFAVLLFQDLAVIPILALLPLLAGVQAKSDSGTPLWIVLATIVGVVVLGRLVVRRLLRVVAATHLREIFTALSLLLLMGLATLMHAMGVSMGLGAFLGGVLLATSEYRTAIETDIEPFKGLLLGLFFMSVGMSINVGTLIQKPLIVVALLVGAIGLKICIHWFLAWAFRLAKVERSAFALVLSQIGEFAFVLFGTAFALGLLDADQNALLGAVVALSMASTPLLMAFHSRLLVPFLNSKKVFVADEIRNDHPEVIIAGFGRVGQIIGRLLYANRIRATVLDHDPDQIELLRPFGFKVYYGDATRLDLLRTAGAETAKILVIAVDNIEDSLEIVEVCKKHFPHLQLVARARNVNHVYSLLNLGVKVIERETLDSSLRMGSEVLRFLGWGAYQSVRAANFFRSHNIEMVKNLHEQRKVNPSQALSMAKQAREELEKMFDGEAARLRRQSERWDHGPSVIQRPDEELTPG